jgi:hypothetical protein
MASQQQISTNIVTTKDPHSPSFAAVKDSSLVVILLFLGTAVVLTNHNLIASFSPSPTHTPSHQQNMNYSQETGLGFIVNYIIVQYLEVDLISN